jgi:hypothetical protein
MTHAFETLDASASSSRRHAHNVASRTALLGNRRDVRGRLGATTRYMPDGSNRDSAFYGVIAPDGRW